MMWRDNSSIAGRAATTLNSELKDTDFMRCYCNDDIFAESFLSILKWLHGNPARKASAGLLFPRYVPMPGGDTVVGIRVIQLSNVRKNWILFFFLTSNFVFFPIYSPSSWVRVILRQSNTGTGAHELSIPQMLLKCERSFYVMAISKLARLKESGVLVQNRL